MMEFEFGYYLRGLHRSDGRRRFQEGTVRNRISNCKRVEQYEGDLDRHFDNDWCRDLIRQLGFIRFVELPLW